LIVHDRESYQALARFVKSALEVLGASVRHGETIPVTEFEEIFTDTSGYRGVDRRSKEDLVQLVHRHLSEIELLPEYGRAVEFLARNEFVQGQFERKTDKDGKPIENLEIESSVGRIYVARFLRLLMKATNSLEFDEQAFDDLYLKHEDFLASENLQHTFLAPIHNFNCATDRVQLTDELQIRRLTEEELSLFLEANKSGLVPLTQLLQFRFAVSYVFVSPRDKPMDFTQQARGKVASVITALRLWKAGVVAVDIQYLFPNGVWQAGWQSILVGSDTRFLVALPYELSEDEVPKFRQFYHDIEEAQSVAQLKHMSFIRIAIRRFNACMEEVGFEDILIDAIIALEAMYLGDGEFGELGYRLSLRTAILLGDTEDRMKEIQNFVKKVYDRMRSKVIHGREIDVIKMDGKVVLINDILVGIQEYLRKSIRIFSQLLRKYGSHAEILDAIDASLIDGETRTKLRA
jgi:hypothetical protein